MGWFQLALCGSSVNTISCNSRFEVMSAVRGEGRKTLLWTRSNRKPSATPSLKSTCTLLGSAFVSAFSCHSSSTMSLPSVKAVCALF
uniref:Uncharacterized protein n=1 Tax=Hyaloperonospora arabidopsidis (strain Emoy2) TaxID=559515 RepID=M4B7M8_HYAAE